ncbi:phenylalanine--tRNA ligase beta subunit, putative [Plasmodium chabaudi adami]|uniref:Phenylalanine--tRNA ligase beta subunit n=1 Tax=Plasmodium chabaudi adami TaxID=5826 RepID=A0A1D3RV29_PLACE|nr:phenylalanine--tRNA ligase beta subunit, putative [Plasmodium chabaudi adami]
MPTISVHEEDLVEKLGKKYNDEELINICFDFGLEIDDVEIKNGKKIYKIEVPANRYDLVCAEGLCRSLKSFIGIHEDIKYNIIKDIGDNNYSSNKLNEKHLLEVDSSVDKKRGYVVSCVLKNIKMNDQIYNNIIELQEKLHHNIGKKRTVLAIGIHDYDKIKFPVKYKFEEKNKINFIPLNENKNLNGCDLFKFYDDNINLKPYLKILKDFDKYPLIVDSENNILSLPPIINGDHTKITLNTKNLFVECTGIDLNKLEICLNIISSMLSEYCQPKYTIHSVLVSYNENHELEKGNKHLYPNFKNKKLTCDIEYVRKLSGITDITIEDVKKLLKKMMIPVTNVINNTTFEVDVPFYRSDIMHACDIVEDIAIAYGYGNIKHEPIEISKKHLLNTVSDMFRNSMTECGYIEVLTNALLSMKENYDCMFRKHIDYDTTIDNKLVDSYNPLYPPVQIMNSKTSEYEIIRTSLIVNLLKFVAANKHRELPLRFFEIGDISYTICNKTDTNAFNKRNLSIIFADKVTAGLEEIHGVLESILKDFQLFSHYKIDEKRKENIHIRSDVYYELVPINDPSFLDERVVNIVLRPHNLTFGIMGIIHPNVLENFSINIPVSVIEINLDALLNVLFV